MAKTHLNMAPNGVGYITFELFEQAGLKHGFSTRLGGVSSGIYKSMNLSFHRGDSFENVLENHRRFAEAIGYETEAAVFSDQIHETKIVTVTEEDMGRGMHGEKGISGTDGLVTKIPGIPLMTFYADCVPLLFYDPVEKVIGAAHSGWRGTVAGIGAVMVDYLKKNMGCKPENVLAVIGPSICKDCYEVSEDVAEEFIKAFSDYSNGDIVTKSNKKEGKYHLDLWRANEVILLNAGILKKHLQKPDICTCHNPDIMISHRQTCGRRGNMAAVLVL